MSLRSSEWYCVQCLDYVVVLNRRVPSVPCVGPSVSQCQLSTPQLNRTKLLGLQGDDKPSSHSVLSEELIISVFKVMDGVDWGGLSCPLREENVATIQ